MFPLFLHRSASYLFIFLYFYVLEHFSYVDADPHEVALWVLLKRTRSANKAIRLQAVQELAENHHWHGKIHKNSCRSLHVYSILKKVKWGSINILYLSITDYQYQTAAQVIDQRTAVGLARTPQVDLRFFLRTPSLPDLEDVSV